MSKKGMLILGAILLCIHACGTRHEVDVAPIEVKPIHITIDVNVKVDKALDDFFDDIDKVEEKIDLQTSK